MVHKAPGFAVRNLFFRDLVHDPLRGARGILVESCRTHVSILDGLVGTEGE